jgi:two-component system response regulator AtoC
MTEIAIVDDEKILVNSLKIALTRKGFLVRDYYEAGPFLESLKFSSPDMVFLDLRLPDAFGLDVLDRIIESDPSIITIVMTAHGNMETAIRALKSGAYDYLNKPFDMDEINVIIEKALEGKRLKGEVEHRRQRDYQRQGLDKLIGVSSAVKELLEKVHKISHIPETTILIRGESGTGKGLIAKAVHNLSQRSSGPFMEVNCASLPENLLESELFGYEKGAFTDARQRKTGLVELADKGTLFLDEIGELPLPLQAKLLQFIESKSFRRIGGAREIFVDLLIITATNRDLESAMAERAFRSDLYYRLNVVPLVVPPLRERAEDVLIIAEHYLEHFCRKFNKTRIRLSKKAQARLQAYHWPGNVRELRNLVEMLVIMCDRDEIRCGDLPLHLADRPGDTTGRVFSEDSSLPERVRSYEKSLIRDALRKAGGVKADAARILGVSRFALLRKIKALGEEDYTSD